MKSLLHAQTSAPVHSIYFGPGVQMIPLFTEGLPPSTHTNAYLVGSDPAYLIDPGASDPAEQERLFALLAGRRLRGGAALFNLRSDRQHADVYRLLPAHLLHGPPVHSGL